MYVGNNAIVDGFIPMEDLFLSSLFSHFMLPWLFDAFQLML